MALITGFVRMTMNKIKELVKKTIAIAEKAPCAYEGDDENSILMSDALDDIAANLHKILRMIENES